MSGNGVHSRRYEPAPDDEEREAAVMIVDGRCSTGCCCSSRSVPAQLT